jgi:hypothetical protein
MAQNHGWPIFSSDLELLIFSPVSNWLKVETITGFGRVHIFHRLWSADACQICNGPYFQDGAFSHQLWRVNLKWLKVSLD